MRKIDQLFAEYAESHQNHTNKAIHWICVPLIFWSILGFVSLIPAPHFFIRYFGAISLVSLGALLLVTIFYFRLSWRIALMMILIMLLMEHFVYFINVQFEHRSWMVFLAVFVISWIGQFYDIKSKAKNLASSKIYNFFW